MVDSTIEMGSAEVHERPTVLVVDDDCDNLDGLADALKEAGYETVCVRNGEQGLAYLRQAAPPVVILLDLFMPVVNGWEFVKRLRGTSLDQIPVFVITGSEPHWGAPVPRIFRKPLVVSELLLAIDEVAGR